MTAAVDATPPMDLAHLEGLRAAIAARAVAAAIAGLVPLPVIDDLASEAVRRSMLRIVAKSRGVAATRGAIGNLAVEDDAPGWRRLGTAAAFGAIVWRALRKAAIVLAVARQGDEAARTFQIGTLFDHYCARLHKGGELDAPTARLLRGAMTAAMNETRRDAVRNSFQHGFMAAARGAARVPVRMVLSFARAVAGRPDGEASEAATDKVVDELAAGAEKEGFVAKTARVVADEINASATPYLGDLITAFERIWHKALSPAVPPPPPA